MMVPKGPAKRLTVYVDETAKHDGRPAYEALMELCYKNRIAGVSVFRGVAGYGSDGVFHTAKLLELSTALPVRIEVVDTEENISRIIQGVQDIVEEGLIDISDTHVIKCCIKEKKKS